MSKISVFKRLLHRDHISNSTHRRKNRMRGTSSYWISLLPRIYDSHYITTENYSTFGVSHLFFLYSRFLSCYGSFNCRFFLLSKILRRLLVQIRTIWTVVHRRFQLADIRASELQIHWLCLASVLGLPPNFRLASVLAWVSFWLLSWTAVSFVLHLFAWQ